MNTDGVNENGTNFVTSPGNTRPGDDDKILNKKINKSGKYRDFLLTLNDEPDKIEDSLLRLKNYLLSLKYQYIVCGREYGKKHNRLHFHIYIQFKTPHKLSIKKCEGAHIDKCRGTTTECINYVKKDGDIEFEKGTPRLSSHNPSIKEILDCKDKEQLLNCNILSFNIINKLKTEDFTWITKLEDPELHDEHPRFEIIDEIVCDTTQINIVTYNKGYFYGLTKNSKCICIHYNKSLPLNLLAYKNTPLPVHTGGFVYNKLCRVQLLINDIKEVEDILIKLKLPCEYMDLSYIINKYEQYRQQRYGLNDTISNSITP